MATTSPRIVFLDDDHMVRLTRLAFQGVSDSDAPWVRALFSPDRFDPAELAAQTGRLAELGPFDVRLATERSPEGADVVIYRRGVVGRDLIEACPGLRLVQRLGERREGIDLPLLWRRGVQVSCLPRRMLQVTAEHSLLLMLALGKQLLTADRRLRDGSYDSGAVAPIDGVAANWVGLQGFDGLQGRTLGIVGLGEVGLLVARLARAFDMRLLYVSRTALAPEREAALGLRGVALEELLAEADYVSLHLPNTPQTRHFMNAGRLGAMRRTAFLINTSRGALVDEDALYAALTRGIIAGAGLDVHAIEPRSPQDRLCRLENVVLTPHIAGGSRRQALAEVRVLCENVRAALAGQPIPHGAVLPDGKPEQSP